MNFDHRWAEKLGEIEGSSAEELEAKYPDLTAIVKQIADIANSG